MQDLFTLTHNSPDVPGSRLARRHAGMTGVADIEHCSPLACFDWHDHAEPRLTVVLRGVMHERRRSGLQLTHSCGRLHYIPPGQPHQIQIGDTDTRVFVLTLLHGEPPVIVRRRDCDELLTSALPGLVLRLLAELHCFDQTAPLSTDSVIAELYDENLTCAAHHDPPSWLARVREFLHDEYKQTPNLQRLAAIAGVHFTHLARVFRAHHACTIGEYVRRVRINRAAEAIAHTREPIAVIAARFGFYDQSHFDRTFRRHYRATPLQYRRAFRE